MKNSHDAVGLIKFFSRSEYLDDFLNGKFFCNTPHYYRNSSEIGVSDRFEACLGYFNKSFGQAEPKIMLDGNPLDLSNATEVMTFLDEDYYDAWLSCWLILEVPESEGEINTLKSDLNKVKQEFGFDYLFLPIESFIPFYELLTKTGFNLVNGPIKYTEDDLKRGMFVKRAEFSYQREYRFAFSKCDKSELKPLILKADPTEVSKLLIKNPKLKLKFNGEVVDILI